MIAPRFFLLVAVALVAAVAASCSASEPRDAAPTVRGAGKPKADVRRPSERPRQARGEFGSIDELEWIERYDAWRRRLEKTVERTRSLLYDPRKIARAFEAGTRESRRVARAAEAIGDCTESLNAIGAAPTRRLQKVEAETLKACEWFRRGAEKLTQIRPRDVNAADPVFTRWDQAETYLFNASDKELSFIQGLDFEQLAILDRPSRKSRAQIRYSRVVSEILGEGVIVRCWSQADWRELATETGESPTHTAGFVREYGASGNLAPDICSTLDAFTYGRKRPTDAEGKLDLAHALITLAHEGEHVIGTRNEAAAECHAMQRVRFLARALGANKSYARMIATHGWTDVYPRMSPQYRSPKCYDGGPLDLRKKTSVWP